MRISWFSPLSRTRAYNTRTWRRGTRICLLSSDEGFCYVIVSVFDDIFTFGKPTITLTRILKWIYRPFVMIRFWFCFSECNCNGRSQDCYFDQALYDATGHGGHCFNCVGNTAGPHCERCEENFYMRRGDDYCIECRCNPIGQYIKVNLVISQRIILVTEKCILAAGLMKELLKELPLVKK